MHMTWRHLLFSHWPVDAALLRPHVPDSLDIDTFDGAAWLGVIPFLMTNVRPRFSPPIPTTHSFCELNVRTYVTARDGSPMPGVWFFTLDAASRLAIAAARRFFHLNYLRARMSCEPGDAVTYRSTREDPRAPGAALDVTYAPAGAPSVAAAGSLTHFLTERYCLYVSDSARRLHRGHIHHRAWSLSPASATIRTCEMTGVLGMQTPTLDPLLHVADPLDVVAWTLERADLRA
jgi:uncharacterized protein YqjF (DUF2071 family)